MARSGAYRKSVQSLTTVTAQLSADEQKRWATELLPDTGRAGTGPAAAPRDLAPPGVPETYDLPKPLDGVRFTRLSAPGPSGMRPEHLRDMLACRRRRAVNRLLRAMHVTEVLGAAGSLPPCWRWALGSRLVFLAKKHGNRPRPVRVGEVWRRAVAKHPLHQHSAKVRKLMLEEHQCEVSIPGVSDILVHARRVLQ